MSLRDKILQVSRDLLMRHGFSKISLRKIAKRANITAPSIYLHFESKEHLLLTLVEESIEHLKQYLADEIDSAKDFIKQLEDLARAYIRFALEHPKKYEIIYMIRPEEMPQHSEKKFQQIRSTYELLAEVIESGKREDFTETEHALVSACTFWAQLHGVVYVILNKRLDARITYKEFTDQAVSRILQGFIMQKTSV